MNRAGAVPVPKADAQRRQAPTFALSRLRRNWRSADESAATVHRSHAEPHDALRSRPTVRLNAFALTVPPSFKTGPVRLASPWQGATPIGPDMPPSQHHGHQRAKYILLGTKFTHPRDAEVHARLLASCSIRSRSRAQDRDGAPSIDYGTRQRIELDHIIPGSEGVRNIRNLSFAVSTATGRRAPESRTRNPVDLARTDEGLADGGRSREPRLFA